MTRELLRDDAGLLRCTATITAVVVTKVEKKSAKTRRVVLGFAP